MNGAVPSNLKNRPRIPTPDVKEPFDAIQTNIGSRDGQQSSSPTPNHSNEFPPMVQVSKNY